MVPNHRAEGSLHLRWPFRVVFLGWWLIGHFVKSEGDPYPSPAIYVRPTGMVPVGENVTIHCRCENYLQVTWNLIKEDTKHDSGTTKQDKEEQSCEVVFHMSHVCLSDGGIYFCRYSVDRQNWSGFSNQVYLNITDPHLPKPSIKLENRGSDASGLNVTLTCEGPENGLTFAFYKSREQIAFQTAKETQNTTMVSVVMVRSEDARNYRCRYNKGNPFLWSEASGPAELEGEGFNGSPKASTDESKWASIGAGLLLLILLLLLVAFVLHRKRRRGSFVKDESQPVSKPLEPGGGEDPEEVSYVVLNHKSPEAKQMSSAGTASESCVYASVAKH